MNRISKSVKADWDLLIYIVWQLGVATNQQIGEKFGLTYSAVSGAYILPCIFVNGLKSLRKYL
jgi:hypothetical protein